MPKVFWQFRLLIKIVLAGNLNDYDHAIVCASSQLPIFGRSDIFFGKYGKVIVDDGQKVYNNINIVNGSIFDELEVFQLIDKL